MPVFAYRGRSGAGIVAGEIEANDRPAAVAQLQTKGVIALSVQERQAKVAAVKKIGGSVKDKDLAIYTRQFSTMVDAGLPIAQCLQILSEQSDSKTLRLVTSRIAREVEGGATLAESFRKFPKVFNDLFVNMLAVGESGGVLDVVLQRLSGYIEKAAKLKSKVKGAMVYPIKRYYGTDQGSKVIDAFLLKVPVMGMLIRKVAVARFTRTLGTLISSGVPILEGLLITARSAGNRVVEATVMEARAAVTSGRTLSEPLKGSTVFPPMVVHMINVGENTGALDQMLQKIADFYDDEVDTAVTALTSLLEPLMIVFLGVVVGGLVVAMYLPIFKLVTVMK